MIFLSLVSLGFGVRLSDLFSVIPFSRETVLSDEQQNVKKSFSTTSIPTSHAAGIAVVAVPPISQSQSRRPFASLMPTTSSNISALSSQQHQRGSANEPHRPFPPTHRNAGGETSSLQRQSIYQPRSFAASPSFTPGNREPHRSFHTTHRNPESPTADAAGDENEQKSAPHQPFPPEYRNPTASLDARPATTAKKDAPHRPFAVMHRNPLTESGLDAKSTPESDTRRKDVESGSKPHRAFDAGYRNPEIGKEAHRPFDAGKRSPVEETVSSAVVASGASETKVGIQHPRIVTSAVEEKSKSAVQPHRSFSTHHRNSAEGTTSSAALKTGISASPPTFPSDTEADARGVTTTSSSARRAIPASSIPALEPHRAFEPTHRNSAQVNAETASSLVEQQKDDKLASLQPAGQSRDVELTASIPLQTSGAVVADRSALSPAESEKSFATAENGSTSGIVHVRLSDAAEAENGKTMVPPDVRDDRVAEEATAPVKDRGNGNVLVGEGKKEKEKGLLRGLKNSLRRTRR